MKSPIEVCASCGTTLGDCASAGLCPRCLLAVALSAGAEPAPANATSACNPTDAASAPPASTDTPLATVGDYDLLETVGEGGMGVVYRARQRSLNRIVAVKMLSLGTEAQPESVKRFRAEAVTAASLQHPNIVAIHEVGVHEGRHFFVMDYVPGQSLAHLVGHHPLPPQRAAAYVRPIAQAIHYAHERGILHRDLKPSNVLVGPDDQPRVTDFGLAKRMEGEPDLTVTGQVMGSPQYLSPEQALGKRRPLSRRTDVYGLGAILYHLLTGRPPFLGEDLGQILGQVMSADPPPPRLLNPSVPRDLETICLKCLEKDPARRYPTAQALADELSRYLNGEPVLARPVGAAGKTWRWCQRQPARAGLVAALVGVTLAGTTGVLVQWRRAEFNARQEARQRARAEAEAQRAEAGEARALRNEYVADMNLAQHALRLNNLGRARALVEKHRPVRNPQSGVPDSSPAADLRGWEWRYVWSQCQSDALFTLAQHANTIGAVAFAGDGQLVAVRDNTGSVRLWNLDARQEIASWPNEAHKHKALAVAPSGRLVAAGNYATNGTPVVELWDVPTGNRLGELHHGGAVISLAFAPDGKTLATLASDRTVRLWSLATGQVIAQATACPESGEHKGVVAFSPDGRTLAIGETDGRIRLIAVDTSAERSAFLAQPEGDGISALAFSGDSRTLASASGYADRVIRLWDVATGHSLGQLSGHSAWVIALAVAPDGNTLASASADQTIRLWDLRGQQARATLRGHSGEVWCVAFSPDGQRLVSGCEDGAICVWDPRAPSRSAASFTLPAVIASLVFSPDSRTFHALKGDGSVSLCDTASAQETLSLSALGSNNTSLAMAADGSFLVVGTATGSLKVWDRAVQRVQTRFLAHAAPILHLQFCAGDRTLVSVAGDRTVKRWEVPSWHEQTLCRVPPRNWAFEPEFHASADGRWAAVSDAYAVTVWDLDTGRPVKEWAGGFGWVDGLAFSPDQRILAVVGTDGTRLFDGATWHETAILRGHLLGIHSVAFSPDGRRLATGSNLNEAVKVWDLATLQEVATLEGQGTYFHFTAFSPDGNVLMAINQQGSAHLWRAPSPAAIEQGAAAPAPTPSSTPSGR